MPSAPRVQRPLMCRGADQSTGRKAVALWPAPNLAVNACALTISSATSLIRAIRSKKSGSMSVAALICATFAPPRNAC